MGCPFVSGNEPPHTPENVLVALSSSVKRAMKFPSAIASRGEQSANATVLLPRFKVLALRALVNSSRRDHTLPCRARSAT